MTPKGCDRSVPPQESRILVGRWQPCDPVNPAGSSTKVRCVKTASVRAAELQAQVKVATPAASASLWMATNYATALRQALDTVQPRRQTQAPAAGEAMEQDELLPSVAPPEQEEREAEAKDEAVRPP